MKIAVDARMLKMSGIGAYISHLMENNLYSIALGNREDLLKENVEEIIDFNEDIYGIKEQIRFPYKKLRKLKPDILHVPHYNVPIFYRGKMVVTIHDLTHLVLPEFLPNKFAKIYAKIMLKIAIKKAEKILTVSENTKKDLIKYFKVKEEKIEVIYIGTGDNFKEEKKSEYSYLYEKYNIDKKDKILMYVGNLKPHKNLERLLEAFGMLENQKKYKLILVGKAFSNYSNIIKREEELNIKDYIIHTGIVDDKELVDLYNLADLFVFPSLYEGFGLPVIESLACGTPVIASNVSSIPEVGGKVIGYFDPRNVEEIKEKIEEYTNKKITKEEKEKYKKRAQKFDWKKTASKTKKIINNL